MAKVNLDIQSILDKQFNIDFAATVQRKWMLISIL